MQLHNLSCVSYEKLDFDVGIAKKQRLGHFHGE